jgi:hypothetical protein
MRWSRSAENRDNAKPENGKTCVGKVVMSPKPQLDAITPPLITALFSSVCGQQLASRR